MAPPVQWETLAKNHVRSRNWASIRGIWATLAPGFDLSESVDISDTLDSFIGSEFRQFDNVTVFEFPGRHFASFQDAMVALVKCAYVLRSVGNCLLGGQPTWASVDAYHFSLIGARTLLALLGIHFVQVGDSHCILDAFPEGASPMDRQQFRKQYPIANDPVRLIYRQRSSTIEQRSIWTILIRALRITNFDGPAERYAGKICELGAGFSRSRNDILYRNSVWLYEEDYRKPTCAIKINDDAHSYADLSDFFVDNRDANFAFAALFARVLLTILEDLKAQSGVEILSTSYGPCLTRFAGFDPSALNALYETMYQKGSYGVDL